MKTSEQRVDELMKYSDTVYTAIDSVENNETRARSMLRFGIQIIARTLGEDKKANLLAGDKVHAMLWSEMQKHSRAHDDIAAWPRYQRVLDNLPRPTLLPEIDPVLDELACSYADVRRITRSRDDDFETDASHSLHLALLALPYAAENYPELDQSKLAIYALIHDIVEGYAGDVPSLGASEDRMRQKAIDEAAALDTIKEKFSLRYPHFVAMIFGYEHIIDDEAKFIKTFDKMDPGFTHIYNNGSVITNELGIMTSDDLMTGYHDVTLRMLAYSAHYPLVMKDRDEIHRRVIDAIDWQSSI
jgi:5'-deoxynucleotidase YfbR-like HD superfamily hydrolase